MQVFSRDPFCMDGRVCEGKAPSMEVDHVIPLDLGGAPYPRGTSRSKQGGRVNRRGYPNKADRSYGLPGGSSRGEKCRPRPGPSVYERLDLGSWCPGRDRAGESQRGKQQSNLRRLAQSGTEEHERGLLAAARAAGDRHAARHPLG
jgi:hypothetical protein